MIKYLENLKNRLEELKTGINNNKSKWEAFPNTNIELHINQLKQMDEEISELKQELAKKLDKARKMRDEKKEIILQIEKRAIGLHADEDEKLKDYNLKIKK